MQTQNKPKLIPCKKCNCQPVLQTKLGMIGKKRTPKKFYKYVCPKCKADACLISESISEAAIFWNEIPHTTPKTNTKENQ